MTWLATTPLGTAAKTFLAVLLSTALASWANDGAITLDAWQTWVIAAASSALPVIVNWLDPAYTNYGRGAE